MWGARVGRGLRRACKRRRLSLWLLLATGRAVDRQRIRIRIASRRLPLLLLLTARRTVHRQCINIRITAQRLPRGIRLRPPGHGMRMRMLLGTPPPGRMRRRLHRLHAAHVWVVPRRMRALPGPLRRRRRRRRHNRLMMPLRLTSGPGVATPALMYSRCAAVSAGADRHRAVGRGRRLTRKGVGDACSAMDIGWVGVCATGLVVDIGRLGVGDSWLVAEFGGVGKGNAWFMGGTAGAWLVPGCGALAAAGCCPGFGGGSEHTADCGLAVGMSSMPGGRSRSAGCSKMTRGGMTEWT